MSKINSPKLWQPGMWALALGIIALPATLQAQDKPAETEMIIIKDQFSLTLNDAVRIALEMSPTLQATHLDPVIGEEAPHRRARAAHITEVDLLLLEHIAIGAREADLRQERATILLLVVLRPVDTEEGSL